MKAGAGEGALWRVPARAGALRRVQARAGALRRVQARLLRMKLRLAEARRPRGWLPGGSEVHMPYDRAAAARRPEVGAKEAGEAAADTAGLRLMKLRWWRGWLAKERRRRRRRRPGC